MMNRIDIPQYLEAILTDNYNNEIIKEAYRNCRFIGATVPHIDPVNEVQAERLKLGKSFDNIPITTAEQSCELLNTGDFDQIIKKTEDEKEMSEYFDDIDTNIVNTNTGESTD